MNDSHTYYFIGSFFKREFKGQSSGPLLYEKEVYGNSLTEIQNLVYSLSVDHLQREIIFLINGNDREVTWSPKQHPDQDDIEKYIIFQDKALKKVYSWTEINTKILKSWRNKTIGVLIHTHSLSISSSADYEIAKSRLLSPIDKDRSGAASVNVVNTLAQRLQATHIHLEGQPISWKIWANYILSSNPGEQEDMILQLPPTGISENFRIKMPNHPLLLAAQNRLNVAHNINCGYREAIGDLRHSYNALVEMLKIMDIKIKCLEDRYETQESLVTALEQDLTVTESNHSHNLATRVTDAPDTDHS